MTSGDADRGIDLVTVGFGMGNYNDVTMEQLADQGDGFYAYVDTLDEAERLFVDELTPTCMTIAKDAKVQVEFEPSVVESYRLIGFENRVLRRRASSGRRGRRRRARRRTPGDGDLRSRARQRRRGDAAGRRR